MSDMGVLRACLAVLASVSVILSVQLFVVTTAKDRAEAHVLRLLDGCTRSPIDRDHL